MTVQARLNPYRASPSAMKAMMELEEKVAALGLDPRLIHLVKLRASQINGCAYCMDMHSKEARADGEDQQRLDVLSAWREANLFTAREKAALAWTEALTLVATSHAPDEAHDMIAAQFEEAERVALTLAIIAINGWNRIAIGFRLTPPKG